jgi:transcriptional regulator with XRE-family HTH domain
MTPGNNTTPLGEAIRELRERLGVTYGQMGTRTGLDPSTIWKAESGKRVTMQTVVCIAKTYGEDVNAWLEKAGFPRLAEYEPPSDPTPAEALIAGIRVLQQDFPGKAIYLPRFNDGARSLTMEEVEGTLADIRRRAETGFYPDE